MLFGVFEPPIIFRQKTKISYNSLKINDVINCKFEIFLDKNSKTGKILISQKKVYTARGIPLLLGIFENRKTLKIN